MRKNYLLVLATLLSWQVFAQGETCANPISIGSLPYTTTDNTSSYGNDYDNLDSECTDYYLSGDDVVYSFTPATNMNVDISLTDLTDTWSGIHILDGCLDGPHTCVGFAGNSGSSDRLLNLDLIGGTTYYIVISTWASPDNVGYTLTLEQITCPGPSDALISGITLTSADIAWTDNSSASEWQVEYGPTGFTPGFGNGTSVFPTTENTTLSPLSSGTAYDVYIRAICGPGDSSEWLSSSFVTLCEAFPVPYTETFNDTSSTQYCWNVLNQNGDSDQWNLNYASNAYEGNEVAALYTDGNGGDNDDWLISPAITLTGNERLIYYSRVQSNGEPNDYEVLLSTTGIDPTDFTETLAPLTTYSNTSYEERIIDLSAYSGDVHVAFHVPSGGLDGWRIYIDNVIFEEIPSCFAPINLATTNNVTGGTTLVWEEQATATEWQYEYGLAGFTQGSGTAAIVTDTFEIISGQADGQYEFYVRAICGPGDSSVWVGPYAYDIGYCLPSSTEATTYIDNFSTTGGSTNISNLASGYATDGYEDNTATMTVTVGASEDFNWELALVGGTVGASIWVDWNNDYTFESSERIFNTTSYTNGPLSGTYLVDNSTPTGDYRMRVLIHYNSSNPNDACASNDRLEAEDYTLSVLPVPTCYKPINLGDEVIDLSSSTIFWEDTTGATQWQYEFGPQGFAQGTGTMGLAADTFAVASPVAEGFNSFYVRTICEPGDTSTWAGPHVFYTGYCLPSSTSSLTYIDNFSTTGGTTNISNLASGYTSGGYQNNAATMSVSVPASETFDWELELEGGTVGAAIWVDWNNDVVFDASERVYNTTAYTDGPISGSIPVDFTTPTGDYRMRVLIHYNDLDPDDACASNARLEVEDYTLTVLPAPSCPQPTDLGIQNISPDDAEAVWTELGGALEWEVVYGDEGSAMTGGMSELTGDNPFLIESLSSNTSYEYYVRSVCSAGDTSDYAGPFVFSTVPDFCGADNFTDDGGVTDTYQLNNDDATTVICPEVPGDIVQVEFLSFEVEGNGVDNCYDWLFIYDGQDDSGTPITPASLGLGAGTSGFCYEAANDGTADLTGEIIVATNPSGCLTFNFTSDGSGLYDGWEAVVTCVTPTVDVTPNTSETDSVFCNEATISPSFWVVNNGTVPASGATYDVSIGGSSVATGTVDVPAGDSVEVTVGPFPTTIGVFPIEITTTHADDIDGTNDTEVVTVYLSHTMASADVVTEISCFGEADAMAVASGSDGIGQYTYEWDAAAGGVLNDTVMDLGPGSYWVYVTDSVMCTDSIEITVVEPAELVATAVDNLDQSATASATGGTTPYSFEWDNSDVTETSQGMGERYCVITDAHGCVDTAFVEVTVSVDELSLESLSVYPNPSQGMVYIDFNGVTFDHAAIVVTDNAGKVVMNQEASKGTPLIELDMRTVENGIYFIQMTVDATTVTKRVVVQQQ